MLKLLSKQKSLVFLDIFFKITALTVLLIVLLSSLLYNYFRNTSVEMLSGANANVLSQMSYMSQFIHANSINFISSVYDSAGAKNLMYRKNIDSLELVRGVDSIKNVLDNAPYVHSVYVYNRHSATVYIFGEHQTSIRTEDFFDQEALNILASPGRPYKLLPLARKVPAYTMDNDESINVFTYFLFEGNMNSPDIEGAVILNVKADWVYESIKSIKEKPSVNDSEILVVDGTGSIVGTSKKYMYLENISKYADVAGKLDKVWKDGIVTVEFAEKKYIMNLAQGDILPWKFVILTPYDSFFKPVHSAMTKIIFISSGVFILAMVMVLVISRVMYNPIRRLCNTLGSPGSPRETELTGGYKKVFDRVTQTMLNTTKSLSLLQDFKRENMWVIRQDCLRRLFNSEKPYKKQKIEAKLKECDINFTLNESLVVVVVTVDNYQDFMDGQFGMDRNVLFFGIINIMEELFSKHFKCGFADEGRDLAVGLLNLDKVRGTNNEVFEEVFEKISLCVNEIQESMVKYFNLSLSFSLSSVSDDSSAIHHLYQEALENSNYRLIFGKGSFITPDMIAENRNKKMDCIPVQCVEILKEDIRYGRLANMKETLDNIIKYAEKYSYNDIIITMNYLTVEIFNTLREMKKNGIYTIEPDYSSFSTKIMRSKSLDEIRNIYFRLFENATLSVEKCRDGKSLEIVNFAKKMIEENYADSNLSLHSISDRLKLSTVYLGSLFKSFEGISVSDYIQKLRVENSARLLTETNRSISEILDAIGWENKKYFNTIFKKYYSVTPSEYRIRKTVQN